MANATILVVLLISVFLFHEATSRPPSVNNLYKRNQDPYAAGEAAIMWRGNVSPASVFYQHEHKARLAVGVGPLEWSETLANAASRVVNYQKTKMGYRLANLDGSIYERNQHLEVGCRKLESAVHFWVTEKKYYNYANNSCVNNHECRDYTQVVWRKSVELECARDKCVKRNVNVSLTVCFYNPPGKVLGEKPY